MQYPRVKPRSSTPPSESGVYTNLDDLVRLQFKTEGFSFLPRQPVHSLLAGRHASRLRGRGLNFEEIRHYFAGDDIRSMDWKVTARTREPHVRVYTEERDRPALLVVDQRAGMFFGSRLNMKSVTAAEIAAIGAWRVYNVGDRCGALVFGDADITELRPHRSRQAVTRILQTLVEHNRRLNASVRFNPDMLNSVLERVARLARHDYLVCIVSDFRGSNEETKKLVTHIGEHNDVLAAIVYDPLETEIPAAGRLVVSDGELQLEFDSADRSLRRQFSEVFQERLETARSLLVKRGIPVLPIHTAIDVAEQVRDLLGHRPFAARM